MAAFEKIFDRQNILSNLAALKGIRTFDRISISEDLTLEERKCVKRLAETASELNRERSETQKMSVKHVVRGNRNASWKIITV